MAPRTPQGRRRLMGPAADDVAEFEQYVHARGAHLARLARLLAGDRDDADDLLQTALVRVLASWGKVRAADDRDAYVGRILVNEHLTAVRRRPREALTDVVPEPGTTSRPPDPTEVSDSRFALVAALRELPPRQRVTVVLRHYADMGESEVAALLGCSVGTVRSQTSRGLATLRAALAPAASDQAERVGPSGRRRPG